jgi:hypothetical protein
MVEETRPHAPKSTRQLALFDSREQDVLDALRTLQLDALTPLQALNELAKLKEKLDQ